MEPAQSAQGLRADAAAKLEEIRNHHLAISDIYTMMTLESCNVRRATKDAETSATAAWQFWRSYELGRSPNMQQLTSSKPECTPEDYYTLPKWQRKIFDNTFSWPADGSWEVDECEEWCTYKQQCFIDWLFETQPLGWQDLLKRAADDIH